MTRAPALLLLLAATSSCQSPPSPPPSPSPTPSPSATSAPAPAPAPASASATPVSLSTFPNTEAGARALVAALANPAADHLALTSQLRPTTADYKALFDAPTAARIDRVYGKEWDAGSFVIAPSPGQTEVKLSSATVADFKNGTAKAKEFPSAYKLVVPHLVGTATIYRFQLSVPGEGEDAGARRTSYDGLSYVNGHWILVPKPWRALDEH